MLRSMYDNSLSRDIYGGRLSLPPVANPFDPGSSPTSVGVTIVSDLERVVRSKVRSGWVVPKLAPVWALDVRDWPECEAALALAQPFVGPE